MSTYILAFESTHAAMASSKTLSSGGFDFMTIPVPSAITAGCGIALKFDAPTPDAHMMRIFGRARPTELAALYVKEGSTYTPVP